MSVSPSHLRDRQTSAFKVLSRSFDLKSSFDSDSGDSNGSDSGDSKGSDSGDSKGSLGSDSGDSKGSAVNCFVGMIAPKCL